MNKIIIYDREPQDHITRWLSGMIIYFKNKGFEIETCHKNTIPSFDNCKLFMVWNGSEPIHQQILNKAGQENIKILFIECGFFPQSKYFYIDELGINADASIMNDDLSWVSQEHLNKLELFRQAYLEGRKWNSPGKYILCPLQLENDTNIVKNAPHIKMQDFINHVGRKYPDDFILFKTHPLMPNINYKVNGGNAIIRSGNFLDFAQNARLVYGQTSTALLETALMKVPTTAIGKCWLNQHKGNKEKLLAALIDRQIPIGSTDLDYWLGKYV